MNQDFFTIYLSPYELEDLANIFVHMEFNIHLLICCAPGHRQEHISMETNNASEQLVHLGWKASLRKILDGIQSLDGFYITEYHFIAKEVSIKSVRGVENDAMIRFFSQETKELYLSKIIANWNKDNRYAYKHLNELKPETLYKASSGKFEAAFSPKNTRYLIDYIVDETNDKICNNLWTLEECFYYSEIANG